MAVLGIVKTTVAKPKGKPGKVSLKEARSKSSNSRTVITESNKTSVGALSAHLVTLVSALPTFAFRSSETTLESRMNIRIDPPGGENHRQAGVARTRYLLHPALQACQ